MSRARVAYVLVVLSAIGLVALTVTARILNSSYTETELLYRCWWTYLPLAGLVAAMWIARNET